MLSAGRLREAASKGSVANPPTRASASHHCLATGAQAQEDCSSRAASTGRGRVGASKVRTVNTTACPSGQARYHPQYPSSECHASEDPSAASTDRGSGAANVHRAAITKACPASEARSEQVPSSGAVSASRGRGKASNLRAQIFTSCASGGAGARQQPPCTLAQAKEDPSLSSSEAGSQEGMLCCSCDVTPCRRKGPLLFLKGTGRFLSDPGVHSWYSRVCYQLAL